MLVIFNYVFNIFYSKFEISDEKGLLLLLCSLVFEMKILIFILIYIYIM